MYLRLVQHVQIRLYYVLPYKAKISAQHGIGFILDQCVVYFGLTMPNLQKKRLLIFEIFNINKCTLYFWNRVYMPITKGWLVKYLLFHTMQKAQVNDSRAIMALFCFNFHVFLFETEHSRPPPNDA